MASGPGVSGNPIVNSWTPGTTYPPGSVVRPTNAGLRGATAIANGSFESGLTDWTAGAGWSTSGFASYEGALGAELAAGSGTVDLLSNTEVAVIPGQVINAQVYFNNNANAVGTAGCLMGIVWYDSSHVLISTTVGHLAPSNVVHTGPYFAAFTVRGIAPSNAAYAKFTAKCTNNGTNSIYLDVATWDYLEPPDSTPQVFYAVQTGTGKSGSVEPAWAVTPPNITDGTVEWSSQKPTSILWQAAAIMESDALEPNWPTTPGSVIRDGTIDWTSITPQVQDTNCPNTKYVLAGSSKIFCGDIDIVRFSATLNPMDWTTTADAGFLPTGMQNYGANSVSALGLYRSNMVVFNSQGFQMWQIDEDPANMALLVALPIGCTHPRCVVPLNDDLFFLSALGVRTISNSAASDNLQSGDVGMPIDPLVRDALVWAAANSVEPFATYYPSAGQFWIAFPNYAATSGLYVDAGGTGTTTVFVYTRSQVGQVGAWSRYLFRCVIQDFCQSDTTLYLRVTEFGTSNESIVAIDATGTADVDHYSASTSAVTAVVQWPWLDLGSPGVTKSMHGVDFVVSLNPDAILPAYTIEVGYDQTDATAFTTPYTLAADTVPGQFIPLPLMAPSFAPRLTFNSLQRWKLYEAVIYVDDTQPSA